MPYYGKPPKDCQGKICSQCGAGTQSHNFWQMNRNKYRFRYRIIEGKLYCKLPACQSSPILSLSSQCSPNLSLSSQSFPILPLSPQSSPLSIPSISAASEISTVCFFIFISHLILDNLFFYVFITALWLIIV